MVARFPAEDGPFWQEAAPLSTSGGAQHHAPPGGSWCGGGSEEGGLSPADPRSLLPVPILCITRFSRVLACTNSVLQRIDVYTARTTGGWQDIHMPSHNDRNMTGHSPLGAATMRKRLRDNSLSLVMFSLFGLCLLGHSLAGYAAYRDDQQAHRQPPIPYTAYVTSSHFWASVFENWESEFL